MAGTPDLFVVCKNCRAEVSPYITECPYCGHRLRKRAPKLDKGAVPRRERPRMAPKPSRGRRRAAKAPRVRVPGRSYVTWLLVLVPVVLTVIGRAGIFDPLNLVLFGPLGDDWWRPATTGFWYFSTAYEVAVLAAVFLFAWLLERRHGHWGPLLVFVAGQAAGIALARLAEPAAYVTGASAGALALLAAWVVRDLLAVRRGEEIESDLLGVAAIAIVLVLLPAAVEEAHPLAGAGGGLAGLALGFPLARMRER